MNKNKSNTGLVVILLFTFLMIGFVIGAIVMKVVDTEEEKPVEQPKIVQETVQNITNVYFPKREIVLGQVPRNSYKEENYKLDDDGFIAYYDDNGSKLSHFGVDVSYHNKWIDFAKVKETPIEFMMVRCGYRGYTEGALKEDEKFKEYAKGCNDNDIKLGIYFFTQAITEAEAVEEAEFVIDLIKDYDISYPVAFDTEAIDDPDARTNKAELSREEMSKICIAFCEKIKEAGYYPMIYCSENWMRRTLDHSMLQQYDIWAAQYIETNDYLYDFTMWQYSAEGSFDGIEGATDLDISMVDYASYVPAIQDAIKTKGEISTYDSQESQDR